MFGYVTPLKNELKVSEYDAYRGIYCGLCKSIGRHYGFVPRLFLSYDFTFYSMLLQNAPNGADVITPCRCMAHPFQKRPICKENESLHYVAGVSVLLQYHKIEDNIHDSVWWKRPLFQLARLAFLPAYHRAKKEWPAADAAVKKSIAALTATEEQKSDNMDMAAATFGDLLRDVTMESKLDAALREQYGELTFHLGRWIYLMDAYHDLEEDLEQQSYNPLLYRFCYDGEPLSQFKRKIKEQVAFTLTQSLSTMYEIYEALPGGTYSGILENTVLLGLSSRQRDILKDESKEEGA